MLTMTATPDTSTSTVRLHVTADPAAVLVSLTRTDATGTRSVRLYEDQGLIAGVLDVTDAESALVGMIRYDVTTRTTDTIATARATTALDSPPYTWTLAPATMPADLVHLDLVTGYDATRPLSTTFHDVIGRAAPLASYGVQGARAGTLTIWCRDYRAALAVVGALGAGETLLLRTSDYPGVSMYLAASGSTEAPVSTETRPPRWTVTVPYRELDAPSDPLRGSVGWTIGASTARNLTLAASAAEFPTVGALLIGPTS